jgi:hypothetical protein
MMCRNVHALLCYSVLWSTYFQFTIFFNFYSHSIFNGRSTVLHTVILKKNLATLFTKGHLNFCFDGVMFSVRVLILQVITKNEKKIISYFHVFL